MKHGVAAVRLLLPVFALVLLTSQAYGQEPPKDKKSGAEKPVVKPDPAVVAKLIAQLGSSDFKAREKASRELALLDEVPDALLKASKEGDLELSRRAQIAIAAISARVAEREFRVLSRELPKVELDRFVRRLIAEEKFAGESQWKFLQAVAKAVAYEANRLGERKIEVPVIDVNKVRSLRFKGENKDPIGTSAGAVVFSAGPTPYITSVSNSLVFVDGDFTGATGIDHSLLIVRGNIGRVTVVRNSIILATGHWEGATGCENSFIQVNNQRIRFTTSRDSVLLKTAVKTTGPTNSRVLNVDKGPLHLLKFSPRKTDDQLAWGQPVNDLAVAITPAGQKDQFLVRWKNLGGDALALPCVRLHTHLIDKNRDDLLGHVYLKGADGQAAPARKYPTPRAGGPPGLARTFVLGPGQSLEETLDLWTYVERPEAGGRFHLSIELNLPKGHRGIEPEVRTWSGTVRSNVLEVTLGK
jgi:hypothetical protein